MEEQTNFGVAGHVCYKVHFRRLMVLLLVLGIGQNSIVDCQFVKKKKLTDHRLIIDKFHISDHQQNFGCVMALFRLSFCLGVDMGFRSVTFAGMH